MIWAAVSSRSCFCWLYRASPSLAAKNIINLISVLTIWWCPCVWWWPWWWWWPWFKKCLYHPPSEVAQSCPTLWDPVDCSPPGSSVHGILQARILEQIAISFSRRSSQPRDQTQVSCIAGRRFILWATREASPYPHPFDRTLEAERRQEGNWKLINK